MSPGIGLAATRLALFLIVAAGLMLFIVPRDSAEFVVLVLTLGAGLLILGAVALLARLSTAGVIRLRSGAADRELGNTEAENQ